ncbi:hypothetical protein RJ639_040380 [Escallonia herrerae]|uniref:Uncharacterized protein n=1 Tax=Escallonia herrerae TaxID=1293975 RepID=A0AA88WFV3_9ASTE|nr:hypothetical protein RJ639_040380 [Escallonia herrerae]
MSLLLRTVRLSSHSLFHRRSLSVLRAAFHSSAEAGPTSSEGRTGGGDGYPSGQFELERFGAWKRCAVKLRMFIAGVVMPWQRVRQGSVLQMHLRGQVTVTVVWRTGGGSDVAALVVMAVTVGGAQIPEQLKSHFSSGL